MSPAPSPAFLGLSDKDIHFDNIFIERLWRSVKYEEVYLNDYDSLTTARRRLRDYFNFYNQQRFHQLLNYRTPHEVYFQ